MNAVLGGRSTLLDQSSAASCVVAAASHGRHDVEKLGGQD